MLQLTLIVPLKNEENSIAVLINSIREQTFSPASVILVDGGSTDNSVQTIKRLIAGDDHFRVIEAGNAMPGQGRNIGAEQAVTEWLAFTDAGIRLDKRWLEKLVEKVKTSPGADIVYGNYAPIKRNFFEKCAALTYVNPHREGSIRGEFIASSLMKKEVWKATGGFPGWRAAEDLFLIEKAAQMGYKAEFAPDAMVYWELRPGIKSTYHKFQLYSLHNVLAGRQAYWHYGIARQYAVILLAILLGIFHSGYWFLLIPVWLLARAEKRIIAHRQETGWRNAFNPAVIFMVMLITLTIDMATFSGWIRAITGRSYRKTSFEP